MSEVLARTNQEGEMMAIDKKSMFLLEENFWEAMTSGDFERQFQMITSEIVVSTPQGNLLLNHQQYKTTSEDWPIQIHSYKLTKKSVSFPSSEVAIIMYEAAQDVTVNGKHQKLVSHCTSTWIRADERWLCAAHTDIPVNQA